MRVSSLRRRGGAFLLAVILTCISPTHPSNRGYAISSSTPTPRGSLGRQPRSVCADATGTCFLARVIERLNCTRMHVDAGSLRMRGGAPTREEMEKRMKAERAKMAEEEDRIRALQERKKREREEANRMALVRVEKEEAEMQLVRKKRRRLPDVPTLEDLAVYAKEMLAEGDTDEAMLAFSRVLAIDPMDANALYNLALLYEDIKHDLATAEEMLTRAVESDPELLEAWLRLANIHLLRRSELNMYGALDEELAQQRDTGAENCFRKALALAPANIEALTSLGSILWHFKEDAAGAQEMFSRAVQYNPQNPDGFTVYASFLDEVLTSTRARASVWRDVPTCMSINKSAATAVDPACSCTSRTLNPKP
jgi:tetratricopeptide (TPR) repeat protein